jgi:hypothetical protein
MHANLQFGIRNSTPPTGNNSNLAIIDNFRLLRAISG